MILFIVFWTAITFASIAWYAFLLFYVGVKAGRELKAMTKILEERNSAEKKR